MPPRHITDLLEKEKVPYEVLTHPRAYTAQGVAALRQDPEIVFNAGTHTEAIRMRYADFREAGAPRGRRPLLAELSLNVGALGVG